MTVVRMMRARADPRRLMPHTGIARLAIALIVSGSPLLLASPARADCPITDPVCQIEDVVEETTDTTDPVVDGVTDEIPEPVEDVVEGVVETVGPVVDEVPGLVEDPVGGIQEPPPIGDPPDDGVEIDPPAVPTDPDPVGPGEPGSDGETPGGSLTGDIFDGVGVPSAISLTGSTSTSATASGVGIHPIFDRFGSGIAVAAKALAFPILLAIVVGAFLLVQNRMDRRDPRLALAPVRPDLLRFE